MLDDGSFAGIGVGARLPPIVTFDGVTRVGLSAALKDTFVGQVMMYCLVVQGTTCLTFSWMPSQRRIPSGFSNNEYVIGSQGSAVSFIGSRPDQSVVFDTAGW